MAEAPPILMQGILVMEIVQVVAFWALFFVVGVAALAVLLWVMVE